MRECISLVFWAAQHLDKKLPPMVIFKLMMMLKEKFRKKIVMKVNKKGWMMESLTKEWLIECYSK